MNKQSFSANKLIPFSSFSNQKIISAEGTSVVVDAKNKPQGFLFSRDAFISFLEYIDNQFEQKVKDPREAFDNPAGRLIDVIEERLDINPNFKKELKSSTRTKKDQWISLDQISQALH